MPLTSIRRSAILPSAMFFSKMPSGIRSEPSTNCSEIFVTLSVRCSRLPPSLPSRYFPLPSGSASTPLCLAAPTDSYCALRLASDSGSTMRTVHGVEVVGVAQTTWYGFIGEARQSFFYLPFLQNPRANCTLLVETSSAEAPPWIVPLRDWFVLLTRASPCLMSAPCTLSINTRACKHCV